jgi:hypothetical protein
MPVADLVHLDDDALVDGQCDLTYPHTPMRGEFTTGSHASSSSHRCPP